MTISTITAILVDDEQHSTASLEISLSEIESPIRVLKTFNKAEEALQYIKLGVEFDLLFLDIEMPGMNGFELLENLENIPFDIIFVTAFNQYAINAFKYSAFDYLLKPIDERELQQCISRWHQKDKKTIDLKQISYLQELIYQTKQPDKLALPTYDGLELVPIASIAHCQSESNYTKFYFVDGTTLLICKTLKDVDSALSPHGFIRIHQSHLVNPHYIKKLVKNDGGYLIMNNGDQLRISKNKKEIINHLFRTIP
jgi:two-component system LytT family response regulator